MFFAGYGKEVTSTSLRTSMTPSSASPCASIVSGAYRAIQIASLVALTTFSVSSVYAGEIEFQLPNPGFEEGLDGWRVMNSDQGMSNPTPEAAHSGAAGLRVVDDSTGAGSSVYSPRFDAAANNNYELRFWGRAVEGRVLGVYVVFFDVEGRTIADPSGHNVVVLDNQDWEEHAIVALAPEGTDKVGIWIHSSTRGTGIADVDDFRLTDLGG